MDLLFREYASPFILLDKVIGAGQLMDFLEVFDEKQQHNELWEFYIHKLPPWDERTFEQFKHDLKVGNKPKGERPTKEQLEATIKDSYKIMQNFEIQKDRILQPRLVLLWKQQETKSQVLEKQLHLCQQFLQLH